MAEHIMRVPEAIKVDDLLIVRWHPRDEVEAVVVEGIHENGRTLYLRPVTPGTEIYTADRTPDILRHYRLVKNP